MSGVHADPREPLLVTVDDTQQDDTPEPRRDIGGVDGTSMMQSVCIIVSIYVGLGLMSQPYAIKLGGWIALAGLIGTSLLFTLSALLLTRSVVLLPTRLYAHDRLIEVSYSGGSNPVSVREEEELPGTLPELGMILWGSIGRKMVCFLAVLELFGSLVISTAIILEQVYILLSPLEEMVDTKVLAVGMLAALMLLILMVKKISMLTPLAALGWVASTILGLSIVFMVILDPSRSLLPSRPTGIGDMTKVPAHDQFAQVEKGQKKSTVELWEGFFQGIGIFAVSLSGHSTLPSVRRGMAREEKPKFSKAIWVSFGIMTFLYLVVGASGYYYWGDDVTAVALTDLVRYSPYSADNTRSGFWWHVVPLNTALPVTVIMSCLAKLPMFTMIIFELTANLLFFSESISGQPVHFRRSFEYPLKMMISIIALLMAVVAQKSLGHVMALVGGFCSMNNSLVLPIAMYSKLSWKNHGIVIKILLVCLGIIGITLLILVSVLNLKSMVQ